MSEGIALGRSHKARWLGLPVALLFLGMAIPGGGMARDARPDGPVVLSADGVGLRLRWEAPPYHLSPQVADDGQVYVKIDTPHWFSDGAPGAPYLPYASALVALPPTGGTTLDVRVLDAETRSLDAPLFPTPGEPPLDAFAPPPQDAGAVSLTEVGVMRGVRLARLTFTPFHYDAARKRLSVVRAVEVTVQFADPATVSPGGAQGRAPEALRPPVLNPALLDAYPQAVTRSTSPVSDAAVAVGQFALSEPGVYALPLSAIQAAGVVTGTLDADQVHVQRGGAELALQWDAGAQRFLFYAAPEPTRWADHEVYRVTYGNAPGLRMASRSGDPAGLPAGTAWTAAFAEENHQYVSTYPSPHRDDHWYWQYLARSGTEIPTWEATLSLAEPAAGSLTATLTVWLYGDTSDSVHNPDHQVGAGLNGSPMGVVTWDGRRPYTGVFSVPATALAPGANVVTLSLPGLPGISMDGVWVDALSLQYPVAAAAGRPLRFTGESTPHAYTVGGFGADVRAYDVTDLDAPAVITGVLAAGGSAQVGDTGSGARTYLLFGPGDIAAAPALLPVRALTEPAGADYLVVAPEAFIPALEPLMAHREAQGLATFAAPTEAIYDVYGDGRMDPAAIRAFVAHAYAAWNPPPAYLLLVGDATWDPLHYLGSASPTLLPPYLAMVDPVIGEAPADNRYATVDGEDILPELAVGRLPANTVEDVTAMVEKILAYETNSLPGDWNVRHILVADDPDSAGDFNATSDQVAAWVPVTHTVTKRYCQDSAGDDPANPFCGNVAELRPALISSWNQGALIVNWIGHSSFQQWEHGRLFHTDDLPLLTNVRRLPVVLEMTCFTGHFTHPDPNQTAMDEALLRLPGAGAVATWGSSGQGYQQHHLPLDIAFYQAAFGGSPVRLGDAMTAAKVTFAGGSGAYLIDTYHLFGDPAMPLHLEVIPWPAQVYLPVVMR